MKNKLLRFITPALILFFFPNVNFAQAPDLGTTSGFALFTAGGAFNNTGLTNVTGNVGTNAGAFNAFPPGTVIGAIHVADATSAQAAKDADTAYSQLSAVTCGSVIGVTLGNGQILTSGVYCQGAASTLNGILTLDGGGNPNALFIIKIGGAFSTSALSSVVLINSASLCNVYWQINGQVDLGDSSVFRGTIIANGAINLSQGASLEGRGLSIAGAISLSTNTVSFLPTAAGTITGINTVCQGQAGFIYSVPSITNATSYIWTLPSGANITSGATTNSITVSYNTNATSGNITVQGNNSCGNGIVSSNFSVTVAPLPASGGTAGTATVCQGQIGVNYSVIAITDATGYIWTLPSGASIASGANTNSITVNYSTSATSGTITVQGINGCGNGVVSPNFLITVNTLPVVIANSTANTVCVGTSVTLTGSGASSYTWTGGVMNGVGFNPTSTITYSVTGTDGNNCSNTASTTVNVNNLPIVTANSTANTVCAGTSVTLTGTGASSYTWTGGVTNGVGFIPVSTITYSVIGTDGNNCSNTASTTVNVNNLPIVTANSTANTVCAGTSVTLTGGGATSYTWTGGVMNGVGFNPTSTITYSVTGTDGNNCSGTTTKTINVNPLPAPAGAISGSIQVCPGKSGFFLSI